jgi:membrane-associated phospholipid phosphatase
MDYAWFVKLIADYSVVPIVLLGAWALLFGVPKGGRYEAYCRVLMAGLTAYLFAKLLGAVYQPTGMRPYEMLGLHPGASYLDNPGFPSDHTLFVTAIALAVWFETTYRKLAVGLFLLVIVVAVGRVLALVHTPLDVSAGIVIALIGGLWYLQGRDSSLSKAKSRKPS